MIDKLDDYLWKVKVYLMRRYGCAASDRLMDPLLWFVRTGRSSAEFDRRLMAIKPFVIGRLLAKGGSVDETITRIKSRIWR